MNSDEFIYNLILSGKFTLNAEDLSINKAVEMVIDAVKNKKSFHNPIYIIGGVASGKSTLAKSLARKLSNTVIICTDDFVKGTREWRRNNIVAKNKNPLLKYDLALLKTKISELCSEKFKPVFLPKYDEFTGLAIADSPDKYLKIGVKPDYIIIEGDFQVFPNAGLQIYLHKSDSARAQDRIKRDKTARNETDMTRLMADIQIRDIQQHFPFTLPNSAKSDFILKMHKSSGGQYKYSAFSNPHS
jgi:uridine kinase